MAKQRESRGASELVWVPHTHRASEHLAGRVALLPISHWAESQGQRDLGGEAEELQRLSAP